MTRTTKVSTPAPASPEKEIALACGASMVKVSAPPVAAPVTFTESSALPEMVLLNRSVTVVVAVIPWRTKVATPELKEIETTPIALPPKDITPAVSVTVKTFAAVFTLISSVALAPLLRATSV